MDVGGALTSVNALAGQLQESRGSVLLTGGGLSVNPVPAAASLALGKAALRSLGFSLAADMKDRGVFVGQVRTVA